MTVKVNFSKRIKTIEKRIDKLPKYYDDMLLSHTKGEAVQFIKEFRINIKYDKLGLENLKSSTVIAKERKGYDLPEVPLYGAGDEENNSYVNMFLMRELKNGWKVYPRWAKHHLANVELRTLFKIHEYGATLNNGRALIRIPPRPAGTLTYQNMLNKRKKKTVSQKFKRALNRFIMESEENLIKRIIKENDLEARELIG
jgi:hypothetical protein